MISWPISDSVPTKQRPPRVQRSSTFAVGEQSELLNKLRKALSAIPNDAEHLTEKMRHAFAGLQQQLRADVDKVDEPQLKALFEESAEVLGALAKTFEDYQRRTEPAWQPRRQTH